MYCFFCGESIPKEAAFCPYCGKKLTMHFTNDNAFVSPAIIRQDSIRQTIDILLCSLASSFPALSLYFWKFYQVEHSSGQYSYSQIRTIFLSITLAACLFLILAEYAIRKKTALPDISRRFRILSVAVCSIFTAAFQYFVIVRPLGRASTTHALTLAYRNALYLTIGLFIAAIILLAVLLYRKRISIHVMMQTLLLSSLFQFSFYYISFQSVSFSKAMLWFFYAFPLLAGLVISLVIGLRHRKAAA